MIRFQVVKELAGWAVVVGEASRTPFRSRRQAITEARALADAIARHGQPISLIIDAAPEPMSCEA